MVLKGKPLNCSVDVNIEKKFKMQFVFAEIPFWLQCQRDSIRKMASGQLRSVVLQFIRMCFFSVSVIPFSLICKRHGITYVFKARRPLLNMQHYIRTYFIYAVAAARVFETNRDRNIIKATCASANKGRNSLPAHKINKCLCFIANDQCG